MSAPGPIKFNADLVVCTCDGTRISPTCLAHNVPEDRERGQYFYTPEQLLLW